MHESVVGEAVLMYEGICMFVHTLPLGLPPAGGPAGAPAGAKMEDRIGGGDGAQVSVCKAFSVCVRVLNLFTWISLFCMSASALFMLKQEQFSFHGNSAS